jgi:hypothetical protein
MTIATTKTTVKRKSATKPNPVAQVQEENIELQPNPFQYEILELVSQQATNDKKVELLQKYRNPALVSLLIWNFDDTVISILPTGAVPYSSVKEQTPGNDDLSTSIEKQLNTPQKVDTYVSEKQTTLRNEVGLFYNFIRGGNDSLSKIRRETIFINLLEGLHAKEAEIIILVKDKLLQSKYKITKTIVGDAYPDIVWGGRS